MYTIQHHDSLLKEITESQMGKKKTRGKPMETLLAHWLNRQQNELLKTTQKSQKN